MTFVDIQTRTTMMMMMWWPTPNIHLNSMKDRQNECERWIKLYGGINFAIFIIWHTFSDGIIELYIRQLVNCVYLTNGEIACGVRYWSEWRPVGKWFLDFDVWKRSFRVVVGNRWAVICLKPHASKKSSSSGLSSEEVQVSANREIGRGFDGRFIHIRSQEK